MTKQISLRLNIVIQSLRAFTEPGQGSQLREAYFGRGTDWRFKAIELEAEPRKPNNNREVNKCKENIENPLRQITKHQDKPIKIKKNLKTYNNRNI